MRCHEECQYVVALIHISLNNTLNPLPNDKF